MSYSLRPGNKLKAPKRYRDADGEEADDPPEPKTTKPDTVQGSLPPPIFAVPRTVGAHHSIFPNAPEQPKMPNIKMIKQRKRMRTEEPDEYDSRVRTQAGRAVRLHKDTASELPPDNLSLKSAAFPSLPTNVPPPLPTAIAEFEGHGMKELVEAMKKNDSKRVSETKARFAQMYATSTYDWYAELRERWSPDESDATVKFESLWPSLRQTIIDEIQDDFAGAGQPDTLYPVQRLLKITRTELLDIIEKNGQAWNTDEDIPLYYRELKRRNPDAIIDPDQPPPAQVVRAIKFLKQQHLPGTLLGEWSTLPSVQVFRPLSQSQIFTESPEAERYHSDIVRTVESHESSEAIVQQQDNEYQARLEKMLSEGNIASRRLPEKDLKCKYCRRKGHLHSDRSREGLLICPGKRIDESREKHANTHVEAAFLRDAAEAELAETRRKDRIAAAQPPQPPQWRPFMPGPNTPRTQRIYTSWLQWKDRKAVMTDPAFQDHTPRRRIRKQTREQHAEELWREADKHPGLKVNQPHIADTIKRLKAAHERLQNSGPLIQDYTNTSITSVSASASFPPRTTISPHMLYTSPWTRPLEPLKPPPPPASSTSAASSPTPSPNAGLPTPTSLQSTTPPQHQTEGQPQIRKKRGPYKKKIKPVAGTFTSPPPRHRIIRDGLVSLAPAGVSNGMSGFTAGGQGEGYANVLGENGNANTFGQNGYASVPGHGYVDTQGNTYTTVRVGNGHTNGSGNGYANSPGNEYTNGHGIANTPGAAYTNGYTRALEATSSNSNAITSVQNGHANSPATGYTNGLANTSANW
ncbi:hypothetical protein A1F97_08913 [Pyrenophora tritici-repentis]|nr:hypothetical protein Alg215_10294 [Pyrenophora tritici-repentis]PZD34540.1 hypothetical protein A1F97_08913 [Pyrenophora tritici-repentis]